MQRPDTCARFTSPRRARRQVYKIFTVTGAPEPSRPAADLKRLSSMRLLFVLLSTVVHAEDRCASAYDAKHPVVSMLEKATGRGLIPSQWSVCGGRAFVDETKCSAKVGTRFKFTTENGKFVLTLNGLSDEDIQKQAKGMGNATMYAPIIKSALSSGLPFNAFLCAREDKTAYVRIVGTGMVKGKGGIIEISQDEQGIRVSERLDNENAGASK